MSRARPSLIAGVALCSLAACAKEVTVHLLEDEPGQTAGFPGAPCHPLGAELCNGGDDDCNGVTDEGCAHTVSWTRALDGEFLGHATGGVTFLEPCTDGSVLTGLRIGMGHWLNQVAAVCRQIAVDAAASGSGAGLSITLGRRHDPSYVPAASKDTTNQELELSCPDGLVFTGADATTTEDEPRTIEGLRIACAPPIVTTSKSAAAPVVSADPSQEQTVGPIVCVDCSSTQAFNYSTRTATGRVATGLFGAAGLWIDRVGFEASLARIDSR